MLVLCVGMYRACSTWQYGVVGSILEKHRGGRRLGFVEGIYLHEKVDPQATTRGWSVLKAHDAHPGFGATLASGRAVGLYAHRDLRDVVFSYMHKTGTDFDTLMERGFVDLCLQNDAFWRDQPGILTQSYDALIADPVLGVEQIAAHLGIALKAGEAKEIADGLSWEANKRKIDALADQYRGEGTELAAEDQSRFDPVSLLHWNHIRATQPARSKKAGTPRQRGLIERDAGSWLRANGYKVAGASKGAPGETTTPVLRTSYAPTGVDIRLDRLFRGTKGTLIDFDAISPRVASATQFFYDRGWRSVNIGTTWLPRDRFVLERPNDLNLARRFTRPEDADLGPGVAAGFASGTLIDLIDRHQIGAPELVVFHPTTDADRLAAAVATTSWRPRAFVVDQARSINSDSSAPTWLATLTHLGYLPVPGLLGPEIYVRSDLADVIPTLARPLRDADAYQPAQWSAADLAAHDDLLRLADAGEPLPPEPEPEPEITRDQYDQAVAEQHRLRGELQGERDMFQRERDSWQRERDAWQCERDAWTRERDSAQRERDQMDRDRAAAQVERDARQNERHAWTDERAAWAGERLDRQAEQTTWTAERADWADQVAEGADAVRAAREQRDRSQARSRADRERLRLVQVQKRVLAERLVTLKREANEQVELRVRQLVEADRRLVETERLLAESNHALAELRHQDEVRRQPSRGLKATLRQIKNWPNRPHFTRTDQAHR